ncbi:MAG: hypothetical protein ACK4KW_11195 [Gemmobacter sp.]
MSVIWLQSGCGGAPDPVAAAAREGGVTVVPQAELDAATLLRHRGLITGNLLDQDAMLALAPALEAFLDAGGRWVFNGHLLRPLLAGLAPFRPMRAPRRADFRLNSEAEHPIFAGIDRRALETNRGVAGFYGRGCNPPPAGALVLTSLGPDRVPVDWVLQRPRGGAVFCHAGNDLGQIATLHGMGERLWANLIDWAGGGPCPARAAHGAPVSAGSWPARPDPRERRCRLIALSAGTYWHIETLEGPRYRHLFDTVLPPEALPGALRPDDILFVPCRTPPQRLIPLRPVFAAHLAGGGTVVAMGESRSDLWLPGLAFTPCETNWWWWLTPGADLGVRIARPDHPLMAGLRQADVTWHLHGHFDPPPGAEVLIRDGAGRAILYEDRATTPGRLIVTALDPCYHHGSHFMPATTRFLDAFLPVLREDLPVA